MRTDASKGVFWALGLGELSLLPIFGFFWIVEVAKIPMI